MPSFNKNTSAHADKAAEAHADAMPSTETPLLPVYTPRAANPGQIKKQLDPDAALAMLADRYGLGAGAGSFGGFAPVPAVPRSSGSAKESSGSSSSFGAALTAKFSKKSRSVSPPAYQHQQPSASAPAARKDYAAAFARLFSQYGGEPRDPCLGGHQLTEFSGPGAQVPVLPPKA